MTLLDPDHRALDAPDTDAYTALLLDYAVGALSRAEALVVSVHVALRPQAQALIDTADIAGGALLDALEPAAMGSAFLPRHARARPRRTWRRDTSAERIALALHEPDALRWGWLAPGIRRHRLSAQGASLLRVAPNREAPRHDHDGIELTLVLRGELVDESGVHQRGDLVLAGPGHSHSPRAGAHGDCICLISMDGSWRLSDWKQRLAARLFAS